MADEDKAPPVEPTTPRRRRKEGAPPPIEDQLARLEKIVEALEKGEVGLEQSIDLYREGRTLGAACLERLEALEEQVLQLSEDGKGGVRSAPLKERRGGAPLPDASGEDDS